MKKTSSFVNNSKGLLTILLLCMAFFTSNAQTNFSLRSDGVILKENQPFYPNGFYIKRGNINSYRSQIESIGNAGVFNIVNTPRAGNNEEWRSFLDLCLSKGIYVSYQLNYSNPVFDDLETFKNHPAMYGWSVADDADDGTFTISQLNARSTECKQRDPNHLTEISLTAYYQSRRDAVDSYTPIADQLAFQIYPIATLPDYGTTPENALTFTYDRSKLYVDAANRVNKPMIMNSQVFSWKADGANPIEDRYPTGAEVRNMTYSGLAAGVKGIVSFVYTPELESQTGEWNEIKALGADVKSLEGALLNGSLTRVNTGDNQLVASYWIYNNACYVVVVNTSYSASKNVSIAIPNGYSANLTSLFSRLPNTLSLNGSNLSGSIAAKEVEVYKIDAGGSSIVSVTSISLNPVSATISVNGTQQLNATVAPTNATNKNVSWSSSNTAVASVNNSGLVTGIAAGNATITATTQDGNKTATCQITVNQLSSNSITIVSAPSTITQNSTNELRITYSAAQAGRIWAGLFDSSWNYVGGGSEYAVNANTSGTVSINATVTNVPVGTGYKWYVELADSNDVTIDGTARVQENVTVIAATTPTFSNSTEIVSAPSTINQNSTNQLRITYSAAQSGKIWAGLFDSSWNYVGGGSDYAVIANTSGTVTINATVTNVPVGTGYKWYIELADSNDITIDGTAKVQENVTVTGVTTPSLLLINPGFEDGLSSGWTSDWGNSIITNQIKNSGVNALQIGSQSGGRAQRITAGFTAGNQYTLSAWARLSSVGSVGNIGVICKNSSGAQLGNFYGSSITNFDAFLNKSVTFTVPAGTISMEVYAYYDGSSSGKLYVDDFNLVTTTPAGISNKNSDSNDSFKVDVYPNPVVSDLNLTYNLKTAGNVTFLLNNSYGNQIKQFSSKAKVAGEQTLNMDVSDLKNGIYFIRITNSDGEQVIKKILVNNK